MSKLEVLHFPDPRLRKKALKVDKIDADIKVIADDMLETMYEEGGIGTGGNTGQYSKKGSLLLMCQKTGIFPLILINPTVTETDGVETKCRKAVCQCPGTTMMLNVLNESSTTI